MRRLLPLFALLLMAMAPPEGRYRATGVHDLASELELSADGRFHWLLAYGSLDKEARGTWRREGERILLTTDQPVRPPQFEMIEAKRGEPGGLDVMVTGPDGEGLALVDIELLYDGAPPDTGYTQRTGWRIALPPDKRLTGIRLGLAAYGVPFQQFPVDLAKGNILRFRFLPNDFVIQDFRATPLLTQSDGSLLLDFGRPPLRYERVP